MKPKHIITAAILLTLTIFGARLLYLYNIIPHQRYTNADFGITTFTSDKDKDQDGIDDQTDILESAKAYVATAPKYQSKYYATGYPDDGYGVCTDVVAFALRGAGYDLQELVDTDIREHPDAYNIDTPDKNIDFRRVDNLKVFFDHTAEPLTTDLTAIDQWQGGDIVVFKSHIGIVSDARNRHGVPFVIHHYNPLQFFYEEDILESRQDIVGHYRIGTKQLFSDFYPRANELLQDLSLEEKVSQLFLVRFPDASQLTKIVQAEPGGFILFAKDFRNKTKADIQAQLQTLQNSSKTNFIFGVDEEGGLVTRVSYFPSLRSSKFASPQELYRQGGLDLIVEDSHEKSTFLESFGLNMNLAPVADVSTNKTSFIYNRTLGQNATKTADYISAVVERMNSDGMISVLKHFPGYGDNADTHTGIAIDRRSYDELAANDFLPFIAGIKSGAPAILVSHNIVTSIDDASPASLSKPIHDLLRNTLDFTGVIMTDDLAMAAVQKYVKNGTAAVNAILAGNDLIITSDFLTQQQEILTAIAAGTLTEDRIDASVQKILALKLAYGIID